MCCRLVILDDGLVANLNGDVDGVEDVNVFA
jgi:hypothetical protein